MDTDNKPSQEMVDFVKASGLAVEFLGKLSNDDVVTEFASHQNASSSVAIERSRHLA